jgi:TolB-like protein/tetratricopeptide (TPR) repeat protein
LVNLFISYSHDDLATARRFAEGLEREGFAVWWDASLRSGDAFDVAIENALRGADAVIVLWSKASVQSRWVRAEATLADRLKTLIPVMIEPCERPIIFELTHTADLSRWTGDPTDHTWLSYLAGLRRFIEKDATARNSVQLPASIGNVCSGIEGIPSIAVLPFANMSGDKEQEYFSDGLAEEIINALTRIPGLKVIARTSAFAFKGQNTDIRRIAETLGVANIREGSVRRSGNRIRVTAQLITATDGTHLWSGRFDRELADVFAVQDEISAAIFDALRVKLAPQAAGRMRHTPLLPAYEAHLKARHFHWQVTAESMNQAREYYEQAIALDPQYALAQTEYAIYLIGRTAMALSPAHEMAPVIRALAQKSLELDPSLVDAHGPLCILAATYDYDWKEAARQFALATPEGHGSPRNHMGCGWMYFLGSGQREAAVAQLQIAVQADPLHMTSRHMLAMCLSAVGRFADAEKLLLDTRALDPNFAMTNLYVAYNYADRGLFEQALPFARSIATLAPWFGLGVGHYAGLLVRVGQIEKGREVAQTLGRGERYGAAMGLAMFHLRCEELDQATNWFERAIENRDSTAAVYLQGAAGEPLRASPHWSKLAALMRLPAADREFN